MPIKKKTDLASLQGISETDRADLSSLFDSLEETNGQIATLRKKSADADEVVSENKKLTGLLASQKQLSSELEEKLKKLTLNAPVPLTAQPDDLSPFSVIREFFESLVGEDEKNTPPGN